MQNLGDWSVHGKNLHNLINKTPAGVGVQPRSCSVNTTLLSPTSAVGREEMVRTCSSYFFCLVDGFTRSGTVSDFPI